MKLSKFSKDRLMLWSCVIVLLVVAGYFSLQQLRDNMLFYMTPTELQTHKISAGKRLRLGGMVKVGSLHYGHEGVVHFTLTDFHHVIPVVYKGVLPDLFRENQGVVIEGLFDGQHIFRGERLFAKHDERYRPPVAGRQVDKGSLFRSLQAGGAS